MPASQSCKVHPSATFIHEVRGLNGVPAIPDPIRDPSTTTAPILVLIAGDCGAGRQLYSVIKDVSVASRLMNSQTLGGVALVGQAGLRLCMFITTIEAFL